MLVINLKQSGGNQKIIFFTFFLIIKKNRKSVNSENVITLNTEYFFHNVFKYNLIFDNFEF